MTTEAVSLTRFKFIHFQFQRPYWRCLNNKSGEPLGLCEWYPAFRMWVFSPEFGSDLVFSADCLQDIATFLTSLRGKP